MFYLIFSLYSDRTYASKYIPIIASVSEHQPPTWPSYFMDINVLAFLVPAGIIVSFKFSTQICFFYLSSYVYNPCLNRLYLSVGMLFAVIWCELFCDPLYCNISLLFWSHGKNYVLTVNFTFFLQHALLLIHGSFICVT